MPGAAMELNAKAEIRSAAAWKRPEETGEGKARRSSDLMRTEKA